MNLPLNRRVIEASARAMYEAMRSRLETAGLSIPSWEVRQREDADSIETWLEMAEDCIVTYLGMVTPVDSSDTSATPASGSSASSSGEQPSG